MAGEETRNAEAIALFTLEKTLAVVFVRPVLRECLKLGLQNVERTVRQSSSSPWVGMLLFGASRRQNMRSSLSVHHVRVAVVLVLPRAASKE